MERDPQTDYEFLLWNQANHLTAIASSLLDALKVSVGLLVYAKDALPEDLGLDNVLENFKMVIAAGENVEKRLGIKLSEQPFPTSADFGDTIRSSLCHDAFRDGANP